MTDARTHKNVKSREKEEKLRNEKREKAFDDLLSDQYEVDQGDLPASVRDISISSVAAYYGASTSLAAGGLHSLRLSRPRFLVSFFYAFWD